MLTNRQLDDCLREFAAVVEQAKLANQYRQAMLIIAAKGNPRDAKVAAGVLEATNDGAKTR